MAQPIPNGYHTLTPSFTFKDCKKAIEFYKKAFGAKVIDCMAGPNGGTLHAALQIGNSMLMMGDEMPGGDCPVKSAETLGNSPIGMYVYVSNADDVFSQAVAAGAAPLMPVADMFWGDRMGQVRDPFGYSWMIATHKQDLTNEEIRKGAENFFAQMGRT